MCICPKSILLLVCAYRGYVSFLTGYCSLQAEHDLHVTLRGLPNWTCFSAVHQLSVCFKHRVVKPQALGLFWYKSHVFSLADDALGFHCYQISRLCPPVSGQLKWSMSIRHVPVTICAISVFQLFATNNHVCWKRKDRPTRPRLQRHSCSEWRVQGHQAFRLQR